MSRNVCLAKFGGGLITDKTRVEAPNQDLIEGLSNVFAASRAGSKCSWVLGHGSGSYGHQAAQGSILAKAAVGRVRFCSDEADRLGVARTADAAARLHRLVIEALLAADVPGFSWLASSVVSGKEAFGAEDLRGIARLLEEGLVPVTMGDVVVGGPAGTEIWSTERVLRSAVEGLLNEGWEVGRVLWFGNTDGISDAHGATIDELRLEELDEVRGHVGGSAGVDVTGGMRLRLQTCAELAALGVESWVLDGRDLEVAAAAFGGERVGGTRFVAA